jgi:hypothetical protein
VFVPRHGLKDTLELKVHLYEKQGLGSSDMNACFKGIVLVDIYENATIAHGHYDIDGIIQVFGKIYDSVISHVVCS